MIGTESGERARPGQGTLAPSGAAEARPDLEVFRELACDYSVLPVWRELVADTLTPVGAFRAMVGDAPGFLLESVEHGERWSRFSFVGRSPAATLVARGRHVEVTQGSLPASVPCDEGILGCVESLLERFRSPSLDELPPLHGGLVGYLGYDVVREIERLGEPPPDDLGHPDAVVSVIGELAAFDHWRQRVTLVDNVLLDEEKGEGTDAELLEAAYIGASERLQALRRDLERPGHDQLVPPPSLGAKAPRGCGSQRHDRRPLSSGRRGRQGVHPCRRRLPGGAVAAL